VKPVYGTARAIAVGERAGVRGVLEERVREGILAGRKRRSLPGFSRREGVSYVVLDDRATLVAVLVRIPARLQPERRAWLVVDLLRPPRPFAFRDENRTEAVEAGPRQRPQERSVAPQDGTYVRFGSSVVSGATEPENGSYGPGGEDA
jgi:hypothetical protein